MKKKVINLIQSAFIILFATYIYTYIRYEKYESPSLSMLPTIQVGDILAADKFGEPQRFDIVSVLFKSQEHPFILRLIGLPGDKITYIGDELCINSKCLDKHSLYSTESSTIFSEGKHNNYSIQILNGKKGSVEALNNTWKWHLKNDEYIVLGDNRDNANDSRYLGVINKDDIISVVDLEL